MLALMGVVLSYATVAAGASSAGPAAFDDICITGGPACDAPADRERAEAVYATPAEVDCPAPAGLRVPGRQLIDGAPAADSGHGDGHGDGHDDGQLAMGACSLPVLDFRYRVSRLPESERPSGAFQPQRGRRTTRTASCTGLPPERGTQLSTGSFQPVAMYAALELIPPPSEGMQPGATAERPSRVVEPLDRPPRG